MKKNFFFALLSAIALTGTAGFSSCSSSEETAEVNPNYDPKANSVTVDLALSISTANSATTRMSSSTVQAVIDTDKDKFRGISNARLYTFAQTTNGLHVYDPSITTSKVYDLSQIVGADLIKKDDSRRVIEMALPVNTNSMIFYGRATKGTANEKSYNDITYTEEESFGSLASYPATTITNLSDVTFSLNRRLNATKKTEFLNVERLLAGVLSCIMNVKIATGTVINKDTEAGGDKYGFDVTLDKDITWASYGVNDNSPFTTSVTMFPLEVQLAQAYKQMTTIRGGGGELRSASGSSILSTINQLWTIVNKVRCAEPFSEEEAVAKRLAVEIDSEISRYFTSSRDNEGSPVTNAEFAEIDNVSRDYKNDSFWPGDDKLPAALKRENFSQFSGSSINLAHFPSNYGVPVGATHVYFPYKYTEGDTEKTINIFYYPEVFDQSGMPDGIPATFTVDEYYYPAELLYFGNSPIRVSDNNYKVSEYPTGANLNAPTTTSVGGWDNNESWSADWKSGSDGVVSSSTRSVAMQYDINYGTALLKTTVKYGAVELEDNRHAVLSIFRPEVADDGSLEPNQTISIAEAKLKLTGLLIGDQSKNVGWDFLPKAEGSAPASYEYGFVSDSSIPSEASTIPASTSSSSSPNYTLVFDNYDASKEYDQQNVVYVALEFKNEGEDFYGNYNLIPKGGTFYLIGKLDPKRAFKTGDDKINKPTWPTYHKLPPYKSDGSSKEAVRVFMQDYVTTANFVIGANSLKSAYLTVPDLRSSSLTLGLSVNVQWETGLEFGDIILGQ